MLLAFKIEANLSKDQILELYINQIYLGQRAYGFAAAAQIYFGKTLTELTLAECRDAGRTAQGAFALITRWPTPSAPSCASSTCCGACANCS